MSSMLDASTTRTHVSIHGVTADNVEVVADGWTSVRVVIGDDHRSLTWIRPVGPSTREALTELTRIGRTIAEQAARLIAALPEPRDVDQDTAEVAQALDTEAVAS